MSEPKIHDLRQANPADLPDWRDEQSAPLTTFEQLFRVMRSAAAWRAKVADIDIDVEVLNREHSPAVDDVILDYWLQALDGRASVQVSIQPPRGWSLQSVNWSNGTGGVLTVPEPGVEESHRFDFQIAQNGTTLSCAGKFKVKKAGGGNP